MRGLALYIEDTRFGLAKAQELRRQLGALRAAGKFVALLSWRPPARAATAPSPTTWRPPATASSLPPAGELNLLGLYADSMFLRGTLDKLKIEPSFLPVGEYKSATEIFTEYERSPAAEEAIDAVLDSYFGGLLQRPRGRPPAVEPRMSRRAIDSARRSAPSGRSAPSWSTSSPIPTNFRERRQDGRGRRPRIGRARRLPPRRRPPGKKVAVVFAEGTIVRGDGGVEPWTDEVFLGSRELAALLGDLARGRRRRRGGAAHRQPGRLGARLRPDPARGRARCARRSRWWSRCRTSPPPAATTSPPGRTRSSPSPATLTGSIGVCRRQARHPAVPAGAPRHHPRRSHRAAPTPTSTRRSTPFRPTQAALFAGAHARDLRHLRRPRRRRPPDWSPPPSRRSPQGRVWTGADALRARLVDELGGLDRALELAREAAEHRPPRARSVLYYPPPPGLFDVAVRQRRSPELPVPRLAALLAALRARTAMSARTAPRAARRWRGRSSCAAAVEWPRSPSPTARVAARSSSRNFSTGCGFPVDISASDIAR